MFVKNCRLFLLLLCLLVVRLQPLAAQDEPIIPLTETVIPTLPPTETATELPSATPLPTETATEPPSATPLPVETETATLLPTLTETPLPMPRASETATATVLPTDTETPTLQPSATGTVTATATETGTPTISLSPSGTATPTAAPPPKNGQPQFASASFGSAGARYRYASDINQLRGYVTEANNNATYRYVIWLTSASYDVAVSFGYVPLGLIDVRGDIIIVRDEAQPAATITKTGGENYRLFYTYSTSRLLLINVTISGFGGSGAGSGGAVYNQGEFLTYKARFTNNQGSDGGAIDTIGNVQIWRSIFETNTANGGGAIANDQSPNNEYGTITVQCSTFQNNAANYGGAIASYRGNSVAVSKSNFITNNGGASSGIYNNASHPAIEATGNWWGASSGPNAPSNPSGTGDSITSNIYFAPYVTANAIDISNTTTCPRPEEAEIPEETIEPTPTPSATQTPIPCPPNCNIELPSPNTWNSPYLCQSVLTSDNNTVANNKREGCADDVYDALYNGFLDSELNPHFDGNLPTLQHFLAIAYYGEFGRFDGKLITANEAFANNYWAWVYGHCDNNICGKEELVRWLSAVHSVYVFGVPNGVPANSSVRRLLSYPQTAYDFVASVLDRSWFGCDAVHVCQWGNYRLGSSEYQGIRNGSIPVVYCVVNQFWRDGNPNADPIIPPNGIADRANGNGDFWTDSVFIISTGSVGQTSTYNPDTHPKPAWLENEVQRNKRLLRYLDLSCPGTNDNI